MSRIFIKIRQFFTDFDFLLFQATNQSWAEAASALRWCQNTTLQGKGGENHSRV